MSPRLPLAVQWRPDGNVEHGWATGTLFGKSIETRICREPNTNKVGGVLSRCPVCTERAGMMAVLLPHADRYAFKVLTLLVKWAGSWNR